MEAEYSRRREATIERDDLPGRKSPHAWHPRRFLHHRGRPGRAAGRADDRAGGRRVPRERGRPGHRRREGHARGDQLHGPQRLRHPLPGHVAGHLRPAAPRTGARQQRRSAGDAVDAAHRRPHRHHHRHLGVRPRPHHPGRHRRPHHARTTSSAARATCPACAPAKAACWSAPATPRAASTWPAWPASRRPPSSARS